MQAFGTDNQAAKRRRIIAVGKRAPLGAIRLRPSDYGGQVFAHVSSDLKVSLRLTVEQSGTARRFNGHQSRRDYSLGTISTDNVVEALVFVK